jgi:hypothetical protein
VIGAAGAPPEVVEPNGERAVPRAAAAVVKDPRAGACATVRIRPILGAAGPTGVAARAVVPDAGVRVEERVETVGTVVVEAPALDDDGATVEVDRAVAVVPASAVVGSTNPQTRPAPTEPHAKASSRRRCAAERPDALCRLVARPTRSA